MKTHDLKIEPFWFEAIKHWNKRYEIRFNDKNFKVGDKLLLREWNPVRSPHSLLVINGSDHGDWIQELGRYTEREVLAKITHIHQGLGLRDGYAVLGFELIDAS